ncbi:hypothetical protein Mrose_02536 [Calidithermus roseus]|uniref:Uncharacterized protein n=2 Tax=Calidithermus roseus TaxID=1644118 RepID=A0A399EL34_9DEIN|nr:hypothetical protein Mrose_02536 [Calidithermus roseus]
MTDKLDGGWIAPSDPPPDIDFATGDKVSGIFLVEWRERLGQGSGGTSTTAVNPLAPTDNPSQFMDGWEIHHGDPYDRVGQKY